ncbi:MAG: hypothetical protein ACRECC_01060 [Pseudolabrys sp.]|jgi:hypothetical protein
MAKRKDASESKNIAASQPTIAPASAETSGALPLFQSPSISPAEFFIGPVKPAPAIEPVMLEPAPAGETAASKPQIASSPFVLSRRQRRTVMLAASVMLAAGIGAVIGALANTSFTPPQRTDVAALNETKALQKTIMHLSKEMSVVKAASAEAANKSAKEIAVLKASLETANKSASTQIGKVADRVDRIEHHAAAPETTGSIPAQHAAAKSEPPPPPKPAVIQGWVVRDARNGFVYVEGRNGIYQVVPGAPLPGLGPVETIKREEGRWIVVTPKGIIVSMRDRAHFQPY